MLVIGIICIAVWKRKSFLADFQVVLCVWSFKRFLVFYLRSI